MDPLLLGTLIGIGKDLIDRVFPDKDKQAAERASAELELLKLTQTERIQDKANEVAIALGQNEVNKVEAGSDGLFRGGWRPFVGWVCGTGLAYQMVFRPIFGWAGQNFYGWVLPPSLELDTLLTLLFGMLGLGAYRTYEKIKR